MKRINITLNEEDYTRLLKCYKNYVERCAVDRPPVSMTGYTSTLVLAMIDRILEQEEKL